MKMKMRSGSRERGERKEESKTVSGNVISSRTGMSGRQAGRQTADKLRVSLQNFYSTEWPTTGFCFYKLPYKKN